jgi:hypothetical protein
VYLRGLQFERQGLAGIRRRLGRGGDDAGRAIVEATSDDHEQGNDTKHIHTHAASKPSVA